MWLKSLVSIYMLHWCVAISKTVTKEDFFIQNTCTNVHIIKVKEPKIFII